MDADHGLRGADFAAEKRGELFDLSEQEFNRPHCACEGHTHERTHHKRVTKSATTDLLICGSQTKVPTAEPSIPHR